MSSSGSGVQPPDKCMLVSLINGVARPMSGCRDRAKLWREHGYIIATRAVAGTGQVLASNEQKVPVVLRSP